MCATGHLLVRALATIHNGTMKTRSHPLAIATSVAALLLLSLLCALVLSSLVACGGSGGNVDPQAVLAAASAKMKKIKGFHFVYEVHKPEVPSRAAGLEIARIIGDVNAEGNMKATIDVTHGRHAGIAGVRSCGRHAIHPGPALAEVAVVGGRGQPRGQA